MKKIFFILLLVSSFVTASFCQTNPFFDNYFFTNKEIDRGCETKFFESLDYIFNSDKPDRYIVSDELFNIIKEFQSNKDVSDAKKWFTRPLRKKEIIKLDFFERFIKVVNNLNIPEQRKLELINYCNSSKGQPNSKALLLLKLEEFTITMGELICIEPNFSGWHNGANQDEISDRVHRFIMRMVGKSLLKLWDNGLWISNEDGKYNEKKHIDNLYPNAEKILFMAKYFFSPQKFNDKKYIQHFQSIDFGETTYDFFRALKEMNKIIPLQILQLLKKAGQTEFKKIDYRNRNLLTDSMIKDYIIYNIFDYNKLDRKKIGIELQTNNDCLKFNWGYTYRNNFNSEMEGIINIDYENLAENFNPLGNRPQEKIILYMINKDSTFSSNVKNLEKKQNINSNEKIKSANKYLSIFFDNDTSSLKETLDLISHYADELNREKITLKKLNSMVLYFPETAFPEGDTTKFIAAGGNRSNLSSQEAKYNDLLTNYFREILYNKVKPETQNQPDLEFYNFIINYGFKRSAKAREGIDFLQNLIIERFKIAYNELNNTLDPISAMKKFNALYLSKINEKGISETLFQGFCRYSSTGVDDGSGSLRIYKDNTFNLHGSLSFESTGSSIDASCSGKIVKSAPDKYILKSNEGDYALKFVNGNCGIVYMNLTGLGKNSRINFYLKFK